jgi:uncharacterized protein (TIGR02421 family)
MRNSNNIIKKVDRAIDAQKPINIHTEDLELSMKSTLPYFLLYRYKNKPHNELRELLKAFSSSFMIQDDYENLEEIVGDISHSISKIFNAFLIIELIPAANDQEIEIISRYDEEDITINTLKKALEDLEINNLSVSIKHEDKSTVKPPLSEIGRKDKGIFWIGLYLPVSLLSDHKSNSLPEHLTDAFKKVVFTFIRIQTSNHFSHYLMHDNDMLDKNVEKIDKELADISDELSFLLNTTPVNDQAAWEEFMSCNYKKEPQFTYRMIKFDPEKIKERLFRLEMNNIKGTTAGYILRQKRIQLEVELTLLQSREAVGVKYLGHYLYDVPDDKELEAAKEILDKIKDNSEDNEEKVDCHEFAKIAQSEIDYLKKAFKNENIASEIRNDIVGLMVDKTKVYISEGMSIKKSRVEPLIQHEIGTHILTYCNGLRQPIKQLYAGFAGYNQLQEGLAVLSEYFVGGLTASRLRVIAARVIAADCLVKGKSFIETYAILIEKYSFSKKLSFDITMRIYRGGGLVKDAVYLRGIILLLKYLQNGGNLELLYTGKFSLHYVPLISKFLKQGILKEPILPNHFKEKEFQNRIKALRNEKFKLIDLIN